MEITCERCDTVILIDREQIGFDPDCPACGAKLELPEIPEPLSNSNDKSEDAESGGNGTGDHEKAVKMLEEPASEETTMWREKLAASFQAANHFSVDNAVGETVDDDDRFLFVSNAVEEFLNLLRLKNEGLFSEYYKTITTVGIFSLLLVVVLILIQAVVFTSRLDAVWLVFGIGASVTAVVLNFLAYKFSRAGLQIIRKRELVLHSYDLLDACGILCLLLTFLLLVSGLYFGISSGDMLLAAAIIVPSIASAHATILFLSPTILNTRIEAGEISSGESGVAFIAYLIRAMVVLSGLLLGGVPVMAIALLGNIIQAFGTDDLLASAAKFRYICYLLGGICLLPMLSYLFYLGFRIILDFYQTTFRVSRDLRVLGRHLVNQDAYRIMREQGVDEEELRMD